MVTLSVACPALLEHTYYTETWMVSDSREEKLGKCCGLIGSGIKPAKQILKNGKPDRTTLNLDKMYNYLHLKICFFSIKKESLVLNTTNLLEKIKYTSLIKNVIIKQ